MSSYKVSIEELKSFEDVILKLDSFGVGFLAIVDKEGKLYGIVTDGDIRKALLNQKKEVSDIINRNPLTLNYTTPKSQIISFLQKNRRLHIPLVDDSNYLKEVFLLNDFNQEYKSNYVVIMAGGLGSRLGELTKETPKPMLQIKGKPILEYILESFKNQGFNKFLLCVNYKKEVIQDYFQDGSNFGVSIQYVVETDRLGTAGALSLIASDLLNEPFFVVNGDVITSLDYQSLLDFQKQGNASAVMCTKEMSYTNPYAEVIFDENHNLISLKEKPTTVFDINLGIYVLTEEVRKLLAENQFHDMPDLFLRAKESGYSVKIFRANDDWMDIGKPNDYLTIRND